MMKSAALVILALLAAGPALKADTAPLDTFTLAGDLFPATFTLPSTITPDSIGALDQNGQANIWIYNVPVSIAGEIVPFSMDFMPINWPSPDADTLEMRCDATDPILGVFCLFGRFNVTYEIFTLSNGQMTFIPGVYSGITITDRVSMPESGTLLLLCAGLVGLGLWRRRFLEA